MLPRGRVLVAYGLMIAATVAAFLIIRHIGTGLTAPAVSHMAPAEHGGGARLDGVTNLNALLHVLLALLVVILAARAVGAVFRYIQQPPVIGEVIAGIMLGPSLLGLLSPSFSTYVFPPAATQALGLLAQIGVIIYMFLVGLELDTTQLRRGTHATIAISHASIIAPFLLGALLALWLFPHFGLGHVSFTVFALFLGVSMSVTAFPVLARILTDRRMQRTELGTMALSCAAVDDVTAWCLLAFVVSVVQARPQGAVITVGLTLAYVAAGILIARPLLRRLVAYVETRRQLTQGAMAFLVIALLLSALATEAIGIHAIFGAFFLGALIPHDSLVARTVIDKLEDVVVVLLLPAFFAFTGLRTQIGLISGWGEWLLCGVIIAVACLGKFGGTLVAGRLTGLPWRTASALGILMNTRGLMELIVLTIGLDLGVLPPALFAMLVLMAVATTLMTTPLLHWVTTGSLLPRPLARESLCNASRTA